MVGLTSALANAHAQCRSNPPAPATPRNGRGGASGSTPRRIESVWQYGSIRSVPLAGHIAPGEVPCARRGTLRPARCTAPGEVLRHATCTRGSRCGARKLDFVWARTKPETCLFLLFERKRTERRGGCFPLSSGSSGSGHSHASAKASGFGSSCSGGSRSSGLAGWRV